jgi:hypothetical protein
LGCDFQWLARETSFGFTAMLLLLLLLRFGLFGDVDGKRDHDGREAAT